MRRSQKLLKAAGRGGFTLIEILLVVVIIGILAAVAVPRLGGRVKQSQVAAAKASIEAIGTAIRLYELDNGDYPSSLQALLSNPGGAQNWRGPYLEKANLNDAWGNPFVYSSPGSHNPHSYDLKSMGPDGTDSADDVGNWEDGTAK
jgi:general secretion pathway protein G